MPKPAWTEHSTARGRPRCHGSARLAVGAGNRGGYMLLPAMLADKIVAKGVDG